MKLKQIFCLHLRWKKYYRWHPARRFGCHIYECSRCGKVKPFEPWRPPIEKIDI